MTLKFTNDLQKFFITEQKDADSVEFSVNLENLDLITKEISLFFQAGDWLFLDGDLGSGKTTFVKNLLENWYSSEKGSSPTFSILNIFQLSNSRNNIEKIVHLDLYRIKNGNELFFLGLENEFSLKNSFCIFEWPYNIEIEEYNSFFKITGCQRPKRIFEISIELGEQNNSRLYCIKKINL
ncbi:tRNA (adenosine(37)-N6)-threonylcarbamoyltransferase complex ATPase subunit type 1 TsaE [Pigmentibacter sp. JX0631]|uniref:tRNA (adenosine(37)-N6)-threonylcarbamoyltransferase complex ATPase subunit type 1 TsaE n=1 Tax=Pigmentibacter sp. JX0631 TaxID=2976982 RepID=UPI00246989BD|nr:tRNA (adenosine(37)-N6)-threonylcarbamoyltransferase complex ATPase subunit type 1 TsaE [Pigmentibacter sp. JX0631]WGL61073.1 tRNA (adenosine(37)-N6)-threonylcarbamoyltransferase complex ATPase subunit type 1 TsaE [Pigmentibacter sp. JX0631]